MFGNLHRGQTCAIALFYELNIMVRKPILHVSGGIYHVLLRGDGGGDIIFDVTRDSGLEIQHHASGKCIK